MSNCKDCQELRESLARERERHQDARGVLVQAVRALEELYPTEAGGYQHSEEYRAVHGVLSRARALLAPKPAPVATPEEK